MKSSKDKILSKSILVVAHPDDEILWFSAILNKVDRVIICYLGNESKPHLTIGRTKSITEHPMSNITYLGIEESEVISDANFRNPVITKYGIQITDERISDRKYIENFYKLKNELTNELIDCENVITHNPWGEYGNEEHIQLYRVLKELKETLTFNLWVSNYTSNRSFEIMLKYISNSGSEYVTLKTDKILSDRIKRIYKKNGCWSWYDDWEWFDEESFIKDTQLKNGTHKYGHKFPLNMINVLFSKNEDKKPDRKLGIFRMLSLKRIRNRYEK